MFASCAVLWAQPDPPLLLERMGILYVGGKEAPLGGGRGAAAQTQFVEQAMVHYFIPARQTNPSPVVMVPGFGLTSYLYLGTPDQRAGWAELFARHGFSVFVFDEPNNAISSFPVAQFGAVKAGQEPPQSLPNLTLWSNQSVWRNWGIGPQVDEYFGDSRYPKNMTQLQASMTPVYSDGSGGRFGFETKATALVALLEKTGPAVLVLHSAAGMTGFEAARRRPDLVAAIVVVEPVGCPEDASAVRAMLAGKPFFGVFGDHFEVRGMQGRLDACRATADLVNRAGGRAEVVWLPQEGVTGNSHLLMQENNNDVIGRRIMEFLRR